MRACGHVGRPAWSAPLPDPPLTPPDRAALVRTHSGCRRSRNDAYCRKRLALNKKLPKRRSAHAPPRKTCPRHPERGIHGKCERIPGVCPVEFVSKCKNGSKQARENAIIYCARPPAARGCLPPAHLYRACSLLRTLLNSCSLPACGR